MAYSKADTVEKYLEELAPQRYDVISKIRQIIIDNLSDGFEEIMDFGMITYAVPLDRYPITYNKKPLMYAALAAQKNYNSLYLMQVYQSNDLMDFLRVVFDKAGLKLNMGKSCVRFKKITDLPLDCIGNIISSFTVDEYIATYEKIKN